MLENEVKRIVQQLPTFAEYEKLIAEATGSTRRKQKKVSN
jgi:hypothetical protein